MNLAITPNKYSATNMASSGSNDSFKYGKTDSSNQEIEWENLILSLREVFEECSEPNWDGYDAAPISKKAYLEALKVLEHLPLTLPLPEIVPEASGEIGMEWYREKGYVFVISLAGDGSITYAGIFGKGNRTHGDERFIESLPQEVISNIQRLFS